MKFVLFGFGRCQVGIRKNEKEVKVMTHFFHVPFPILLSGRFVLSTKYIHIKSTTVYAPRRNWDSPQPPTRRLVCPLPPVSGGRGTLAGEKGVGRVRIPTKGIHCGTLYMYVLCGVETTVCIAYHVKEIHTQYPYSSTNACQLTTHNAMLIILVTF
jgi:hypothetical protein